MWVAGGVYAGVAGPMSRLSMSSRIPIAKFCPREGAASTEFLKTAPHNARHNKAVEIIKRFAGDGSVERGENTSRYQNT